jgi:hypothetical protein
MVNPKIALPLLWRGMLGEEERSEQEKKTNKSICDGHELIVT